MIDLDPQQSAERWHAIRQSATGAKDDPSIAAGPYQKLPDMLKTARKLGAELVLIDTPPKLDKAIIPSLKAATLVLVPLKSTFLIFRRWRTPPTSSTSQRPAARLP